MLFNSLEFAVFFPVVTILYFLSPHQYRTVLLLAASCYFYMAFIPVYIFILAFTIIIDYAAGILIESSPHIRRKSFLIMSICANVGVLAFFKYYGFIAGNLRGLSGLFNVKCPIPMMKIILPIGLSFHTFQAMSYTIEVYRGNQKAERNFITYALYVMFYPQKVMTSYMYGLALSYFLWPNHYAMYDFFICETGAVKKTVKRYLEIGAGHGLFLSKALDAFDQALEFTVVDISEACIAMGRAIIRRLSRTSAAVDFRHMDVMSFDAAAVFDFISMGEVMEHVEDPGSLLEKARGLLAPRGSVYISTCCNCPAVDHIYLFRNIHEIRDLFRESGLRVSKEIVLPVEGPERDIDEYEQVAANYAATLRKENS